MNVMPSLLVFVVGFILGSVFGFFLDRYLTGKKINEDNLIIKVVIGIAWLASVLMDMINPNYSTPIHIHLLMGGLLGILNPNIINIFTKK